nr:flagellar hook-basal body complex protein [Bacilli bacterium]
MLRSLYSAISGMNAFQTQLDVTGNNIANVDTTGFKAGRVEFSDILSQTMSNATQPTAAGTATPINFGPGGINPQQIGLGVNVASIDTMFTQGADQQTGVPTDMALDGDGLFIVSPNMNTVLPTSAGTAPSYTGTATGVTYNYSRAGNFSVDAQGNLVLPDGSKLMGYELQTSATGTSATLPTNLNKLVPINISIIPSSPTGTTTPVPGNFTIGTNGVVTVTDPTNPSNYFTFQIALANFNNPGGLQKVGNNLYETTSNSGQFNAGAPSNNALIGIPGSNGFANVRPGYLEASNVNLTQEFTNMIVAQQGFDANSKVVNTDNNILSTIDNLEQQA